MRIEWLVIIVKSFMQVRRQNMKLNMSFLIRIIVQCWFTMMRIVVVMMLER